MGDNRFRDMQQGVGRKQVVVVEKGDKVTGGEGERGIGGRGDMTIGCANHELDAGVRPGGVAQDFADVGVRRGIVGDAELPIRIILGRYRGDELLQKPGRGVVNGDDNTDLGTGPGQRAGLVLEVAGEAGREPIVAHPEGVGVLLLPRGGRRRPRGLPDHLLRKFLPGLLYLGPEAGPALHPEVARECAPDEGPHGPGEVVFAENRDRAGVLIDLIQEKPLRPE